MRPRPARATGTSASKSRRTFEGHWTRTGDKYIRDAEGRYTFCGRADDMFKVSGIWVSPFEVESALITHPAVLEAAVVPEADPEGLLKPKAFVVLRPARRPTDLQEMLKEHVKQKIGPWKYPRWIDVVESPAEDGDRKDPAVQVAGGGELVDVVTARGLDPRASREAGCRTSTRTSGMTRFATTARA